ncbi:cytochrome c3 family protein [Thermodesulfobacteriota bacterium]
MAKFSLSINLKRYICFFILSAFFILSFCAEVRSENEFSQDRKCIICHVSQSEEFKDLVKKKVFDVEISSLVSEEVCYSCHNISVKDTREIFSTSHHPVKVVPSSRVRIPSEYTLNEKGEMDCGTCHTPHTKKGEGGKTSFMREVNVESSMCVRCHVQLTKGAGSGAHKVGMPMATDAEVLTSRGGKVGEGNKVICETCHMIHGAPREKLLIFYEKDGDFCLLCHDENPSKEDKGFGDDTHPANKADIKSEVPKTWPNKRTIRRANDGGFECQTCHRVHYGYKGLLAYKNSSGEMCATCHKGKTNTDADLIKKNHVIIPATKEKKGVECLSCHRAHNAFYDPESEATKLLVKNNENSDLCYECHGDKKTDSIIIAELAGNHPNNMPFTETKKMREKLKSLGGRKGSDNKIICNSCHSVHDAKTDEANLVMKKDKICLYCHNSENFFSPKVMAKGTHPHNVRASKATISVDAYEKGQVSEFEELICLTCHKVHSAVENTKLMAYESSKDKFCVSCHTKLKPMFDGPHNMKEAAPKLVNKYGQTTEESGMCGACHSAHAYSREMTSDEDIVNQVCLDCHDEDGPGTNMLEGGTHNHPYTGFIEEKFRLFLLPLYNKFGKKVSRNGKLACSTCHDIHEHEDNKAGVKLLRIESNIISNLCFKCHPDKMSIMSTTHDFSVVDLGGIENIKGDTLYEGGVCSSCHVVHGGTSKFGFSQALIGDVVDVRKNDPVTVMCQNCHTEDGIASKKPVKTFGHVVNVSMKNPSLVTGKLPLYNSAGNMNKGDNVLCSTCHDPHIRGATMEGIVPSGISEGNSSNNFLRMNYQNPDTLCIICHREEALIEGTVHDIGSRKKGDDSQSVCNRCHSIHNPTYDALIFSMDVKVKDKGDNFAEQVCFTCHNRKRYFGSEEKKKVNHPNNRPMNVAYGAKKIKTTLPLYDEEFNRDQENGNIVCFSCHDIHRWNPKSVSKRGGIGVEGETSNSFLRISSDDGYLCTNCHEKQIAIFNSEHDLRVSAPYEENRKGENPEESGPCGVCHVTHNANRDGILLWNRKLKRKVPKQVKGAPVRIMKPDNKIKLTETCLSCHADGKVAFNKQTLLNYHIPQKERIVTYGKKLALMNIMPFTSNFAALENAIFPLYNADLEKSQEGYLQCVSCHDPHQWSKDVYNAPTGKPEEGDVSSSFLRLQLPEMAGASFCKECHRGEVEEKYLQYHLPPPEPEFDDYDDYDDDDYYDE